jgi:hypothetical protein
MFKNEFRLRIICHFITKIICGCFEGRTKCFGDGPAKALANDFVVGK